MTAVFSPLWQPCQCRHINAMSIFPLSILFISLLLSCLKTRSGCQPTYTKSIASFAFCARLEIDESLKTSNVYCQIGLSADAFPNEKRVIFHLLTTMKWRILSTWESSPPLSAWKKKRERVCRIVGFFFVCAPPDDANERHSGLIWLRKTVRSPEHRIVPAGDDLWPIARLNLGSQLFCNVRFILVPGPNLALTSSSQRVTVVGPNSHPDRLTLNLNYVYWLNPHLTEVCRPQRQSKCSKCTV